MDQDQAVKALQKAVDDLARLENVAGKVIRFDVPLVDQFTPAELERLTAAFAAFNTTP